MTRQDAFIRIFFLRLTHFNFDFRLQRGRWGRGRGRFGFRLVHDIRQFEHIIVFQFN